ncbi:MAG TPA: hypothetical protein VMB03_08590 [Bryobacteraceae bacterium]|nr:hypothetical protein [Bryobacteraceae bacterium]
MAPSIYTKSVAGDQQRMGMARDMKVDDRVFSARGTRLPELA